jgi:hypothetical protein
MTAIWQEDTHQDIILRDVEKERENMQIDTKQKQLQTSLQDETSLC